MIRALIVSLVLLWILAGPRSDGPATQAPSLLSLARASLSQLDGTISVPGLKADVQVLRDEWGVPHIYAKSDRDLFFAQGYVAAQDRLWQMEMWRRAAEGRLAEVLGASGGRPRSHGQAAQVSRPLRCREFESYHPDAKRLMTAFVAGVNAFIASHADRLPVEFVLTGIKPEPWTVEALLLRQVTFGDATSELQLARQVASLGAGRANRRRNPDPWDDLAVPNGLDVASIGDDVLAATRGGGRACRGRRSCRDTADFLRAHSSDARTRRRDRVREPGSNNWVVERRDVRYRQACRRQRSAPGGRQSVPSLHLPSQRAGLECDRRAASRRFVGIGLGHNERVAWGLTIVGTDQHDVYVEELNPGEPERGPLARRLGAASYRPRGDRRQGCSAADHRTEVQPARADLLRGSREEPRICSAIGAARAGHGAVSRRPAL